MQNLLSLSKVVFKRLLHNLGISISALVGIVAVLAMVVCVPIFSNAVSSYLLKNQLEEKVAKTHRRLFSLHYYFMVGKNVKGLTLDTIDIVSEYIRDHSWRILGLPVEQIVVDIQSGAVRMTSPNSQSVTDTLGLKPLKFAVRENLPIFARLIEGQWPAPSTNLKEPIPVAVLVGLADEMYLNVGDRLAFGPYQVEIAGIWQENNPEDPIWFKNPSTEYSNLLWVPLETFRTRIQPVLDQPFFYISWYVIYSESQLRYQRAPHYARSLIRLESNLKRMMPGIQSDYSPIEQLLEYQKRSQRLMTLFYAVGSPLVILALMFISLTASIAVQQYEQETVTLRGRGTSWKQILYINVIESLLLILIAVPLALALGWLGAVLIGQTESFLKFTGQSNYTFSFTGINLPVLVLAAVLIILARLFPMIRLSRISIIQLKQEQSRSTRRPIWARLFLDVLLLGISLYAYTVMRGWAKPAGLMAELQSAGGVYRDPLLFLAPALFAIAGCMLVLRLLPLLLKMLARPVDRLPGVWAYLSLEQVIRRPQDYNSALLLVMISLSLAIYSASSAKTLDNWLRDSAYYKSGADLAIQEFLIEGGGQMATVPGSASSSGTTLTEIGIDSSAYVSPEDHMKLPSVNYATRVGKYRCTFSYGAGNQLCTAMGIERLDFPKVAYFRNDFASEPLGALMNALAAEPAGVLIPTGLAQELGLQIGDQLQSSITVYDQKFERNLVVVGFYDYFPTVYPADRPTLIMNLEHIFNSTDVIYGYHLWLDIREDTDLEALLMQFRMLIGIERAVVKVHGNAFEEVRKGSTEPERVGMFGILNVGFLMTGLMPGIGFVLYSYASLRRRFVQLGILQALGLSVRQLIGYVVSEQFLLMGLAIFSGAVVGLLASYLYLPFLQVSDTPGAVVPPFIVQIGWTEALGLSLVFTAILLATIAGTILYLVRLKVFQAVKLGEVL